MLILYFIIAPLNFQNFFENPVRFQTIVLMAFQFHPDIFACFGHSSSEKFWSTTAKFFFVDLGDKKIPFLQDEVKDSLFTDLKTQFPEKDTFSFEDLGKSITEDKEELWFVISVLTVMSETHRPIFGNYKTIIKALNYFSLGEKLCYLFNFLHCPGRVLQFIQNMDSLPTTWLPKKGSTPLCLLLSSYKDVKEKEVLAAISFDDKHFPNEDFVVVKNEKCTRESICVFEEQFANSKVFSLGKDYKLVKNAPVPAKTKAVLNYYEGKIYALTLALVFPMGGEDIYIARSTVYSYKDNIVTRDESKKTRYHISNSKNYIEKYKTHLWFLQ